MKTLKLLYVSILLALLSGCNSYDDSQILLEVDNLKSRVSTLEQLCKNMNENISSLQTIVTALQKNEFVTSVTNLPNDSGYTISFTSGKTINIYNGSDGSTPKISVRQDADGEYYWTVDGEWLVVAGKKVKATGKDGSDGNSGIAPEFKIEDGYWYVTYDWGNTWEELGKATGENGDKFFQNVCVNENYAVLTLSDGTIIKLPLASTSTVNKLRYIPDYSDGVARAKYSYIDAEYDISFESFTMDYEVFPSSALNTILQNWRECLSVVVVTNDIATKSYCDRITLEINNVSADDGILSIEINPESLKKYIEKPGIKSNIAFNIAVSFEIGGTTANSEYSGLKFVRTNEVIIIEYTTKFGTKISDLDLGIWGPVVEDTYIDGVGRVVMISNQYSVSFDISPRDQNTRRELTSINFLTPISVSSISFKNCENLKYANLSNLNTSNVTDMSGMFIGCEKLTNIELSSFDTSNVTDMAYMFWGCQGLTELDLTGFDTSNVTDMSCMFDGCKELSKLDLSNFDTSNVTDMSGMFEGCQELSKLDLSNFDTSNVTDMSYMFGQSRYFFIEGCNKLTNIDLSSFDTSNVTDMAYMFWGCQGLTELDLTGFDTSNVTDMAYMFWGCQGLTELDLTGFDTSNVIDMSGMFWGCTGLTSLDLSSFDTSDVLRMYYMFEDCRNIEYLDLKGFDTTVLYDYAGLFNNCIGLKTIDLSNWNLRNGRRVGIFSNNTDCPQILEKIIMKGCNSATIEIIEFSKPESATIVY